MICSKSNLLFEIRWSQNGRLKTRGESFQDVRLVNGVPWGSRLKVSSHPAFKHLSTCNHRYNFKKPLSRQYDSLRIIRNNTEDLRAVRWSQNGRVPLVERFGFFRFVRIGSRRKFRSIFESCTKLVTTVSCFKFSTNSNLSKFENSINSIGQISSNFRLQHGGICGGFNYRNHRKMG